jgi:predicted unusual protein kinase regulating ubiquinone biosynthesis (AarF/ABC1/UbiB family)
VLSEESTWDARLRELRRLLGWSQRRFAKEMRVTPAAVSQWESGSRGVPGPVKRLVEIYERSMAIEARSATSTRHTLRGLLESHAHASELKAAVQDAMAEQVAIALGNMKGLPLKLGRIAAHIDFAVPQRVRDALRAHEPPALGERAISEAVRKSLGDLPERLFARWEPRPFAVASIGQVHRARLEDGTEVAVKVQYPGIRRAIERDLIVLDALLGALWGRTEALVDELRARLLEECDYETEASHQERMRALNARCEGVVIARVHRARSSRTVLTSDLIQGVSLHEFARTADQADRDRAGTTLFAFAARNMFRHGLFHADPHPSNFLFLPGSVAFLDFGSVTRVPRAFARAWGRYVHAILNDRRSDADDLLIELGIVGDRDRFDFAHEYSVLREVFEPWRRAAPFRFERHYVERTFRAMTVENPNLRYTALQPNLLVLLRLMWGLHTTLADLGAAARWGDIIEENRAYAELAEEG